MRNFWPAVTQFGRSAAAAVALVLFPPNSAIAKTMIATWESGSDCLTTCGRVSVSYRNLSLIDSNDDEYGTTYTYSADFLWIELERGQDILRLTNLVGPFYSIFLPSIQQQVYFEGPNYVSAVTFDGRGYIDGVSSDVYSIQAVGSVGSRQATAAPLDLNSDFSRDTFTLYGDTWVAVIDGREVGVEPWGRLSISAAVPEAGTWVTLIAGFGLTGAMMRRRRIVQLA